MSPDSFARVRVIIASYLEIAPERVQPDAKLEDLGLDSLGALEVVFQVEEEFRVVVPQERVAEFSTVREICDGIEALLDVPAAAPAAAL